MDDNTQLIKELQECIEEQSDTIRELQETNALLENGNITLFDEVQDLRRYKHAVNALMFLYNFCKEKADK